MKLALQTLGALACVALFSGDLLARDIYVSSETGSNDGDGSKEKPKKLLWKVIGELQPGDHVRVAEGLQSGKMDCGAMPQFAVSDVTLEGGWKKDWSERDPFTYRTVIGLKPGEKIASGDRVFHVEDSMNKIKNVTIDGFCIDRGEGNYYTADGPPGAEKRIEGHADTSPWGYRAMNQKKSGSNPTIAMIGMGNFTVRNCILINNPWVGIYVKCGDGQTTIENNLIIVSRTHAIESIPAWGKGPITIRNNTVLFNHAEGNGLGRAITTDPKGGATYLVQKNVLAFSDGTGVDTKFPFKGKTLTVTDNTFFFNRRGDAGASDGAGCNVESFEDNLEYNTSKNTHELPKCVAALPPEWVDRYSTRERVDMCSGNNKWDELKAARKAVGLPDEYHLVGYEKTYPDYKSLPDARPGFEMSRFPKPLKQGEGVDWAVVTAVIGKDGERGVQAVKK